MTKTRVKYIILKTLKKLLYFIKELLFLGLNSIVESWHFIKIILKTIIVTLLVCSILTIIITKPLWSKYKSIAEENIEKTDITYYRQYVVPELNDVQALTLLETTNKYILRKDIPKLMMTTMIENVDPTFKENKGVDWYRIIGAIRELKNSQGSNILDIDTITQKTVETMFLKEEKGVDKFCEKFAMALKMNDIYSKDTILEIYFNVTDFTHDIKGIQQAAYTYFNKDVRKLSIRQQIYLCVIMLDSREYNPNEDIKAVSDKCNEILEDLYKKGYINKQEYIGAKNEHINMKLLSTERYKTKEKEPIKPLSTVSSNTLSNNAVNNDIIVIEDTKKDEDTKDKN